ncbi:MAG: hypothetical protein A2512_13050 [Deltaproteobacteria bacterium RIFOXYD12_FULL_56_24]|nr:MAG: hypothetical protein A2512_13050 [Deltaproteobacteria bacterium RIFOXYD12_FULL_56_24]
MKITAITPGQQDVSPIGKSFASTRGPSFQDVLANEMAVAKNPATSSIAATATIAPIPAELRLDSLSLAENTISTLEKFGDALANPSFSAQDLEPFAAALEDETAALVSLKNQLPEGNSLSSLMERVATASYVEAAKLRRGDYHA